MYRIALGYDLHRMKFMENSSIVCGGIQIVCNQETDGAHSDGDVVFHAITDGLLSTVGKDIGIEFSNTDISNKNRNSQDFVEYSYNLIKDLYDIINIDIVVICDTPKIAPYALQIRSNIAQILNLDLSCITIRGKTTEQTSPLTIASYVNILFKKSK